MKAQSNPIAASRSPAGNGQAETENQSRTLDTLQRLLQIRAADLEAALNHAADAVAAALAADKVDAFMYVPEKEALVALGVSNQPLSAKQRRYGLDVLQIANGGHVVSVFETGETYSSGRVDLDASELKGIRETLGVRSAIGVPLEVRGKRRGMLMIASQKPDFFTPGDTRFAESVAHWVGLIASHADLTEEIAKNAVEHGRRAAAEELITVLAHDLRNFLAPLDLRLTAIHRRAERDGRENDVREIGLARRQLGRLNALVSDILDVARIDQGVFGMRVQSVDLVRLIEESARDFSSAEQEIRIRAAEPLVVGADPERLKQCLENLFSNALKHSPKSAPVLVAAYRESANDGEWACVDVVDEGPGVPPEMLPRIFEPFVTESRGSQGLGLGLYLARRIALMHDGQLTVESQLGKGARFSLKLPCCVDS